MDFPDGLMPDSPETPTEENYDVRDLLQALGVSDVEGVASALEAWKSGDNGPVVALVKELKGGETDEPTEEEPMGPPVSKELAAARKAFATKK